MQLMCNFFLLVLLAREDKDFMFLVRFILTYSSLYYNQGNKKCYAQRMIDVSYITICKKKRKWSAAGWNAISFSVLIISCVFKLLSFGNPL